MDAPIRMCIYVSMIVFFWAGGVTFALEKESIHRKEMIAFYLIADFKKSLKTIEYRNNLTTKCCLSEMEIS